MDIHTQELRLRFHLKICRTCSAAFESMLCAHGSALWRGWVLSHRQHNRRTQRHQEQKIKVGMLPFSQVHCQRCKWNVLPEIKQGDLLCPYCGLVL